MVKLKPGRLHQAFFLIITFVIKWAIERIFSIIKVIKILIIKLDVFKAIELRQTRSILSTTANLVGLTEVIVWINNSLAIYLLVFKQTSLMHTLSPLVIHWLKNSLSLNKWRSLIIIVLFNIAALIHILRQVLLAFNIILYYL